MFNSIYLENFKSFKKIELILEKKRKESKNFSILYGGNGSGKSSIAQAFAFLSRSLKTLAYNEMLQEFMTDSSMLENDIPIKPDMMLELIKKTINENQLNNIIRDYKMIGTDSPMILKYEFTLDNKYGSYIMEFNDNQLIHERLDYALNKNKTCCYDISCDSITINQSLFNTKIIGNKIIDQINMFWGKHSFLSIITKEIEDKSISYINESINNNIIEIIDFFSDVAYNIKIDRLNYDTDLPISNTFLQSLTHGSIEASDENELDKIEKILSKLLSDMFDNVLYTFYSKEYINNQINYTLIFHKQIDNTEFDIEYSKESNGTKEILILLPYVMHSILGGFSVIDEFGSGIHEMLISKFLNAIIPEIKGQLILLSHNSTIMNDVLPDSVYFITNTHSYNKSIKCISDIETRMHPNYNYQSRYMQNELYLDTHPYINEEIDLQPLSNAYYDILTSSKWHRRKILWMKYIRI